MCICTLKKKLGVSDVKDTQNLTKIKVCHVTDI